MKKIRSFVLFFSLCLLFTGPLLAQETGEIIGNVTDEEGISLPGVAITAISPNLQGKRIATTANDGTFRLPLLPIGVYKLTFQLQGFATVIQENVGVKLGMVTSVNIKMKVATLEEQLTVVAEAPLIDKTKADTSFNLRASELAKIPIQGRTIQEVMNFTPGVTGVRHDTNFGIGQGATDYGAGSFRAEGGSGNNYLVDGLSKRGADDNSPGVRVNFDAWDEVQIISDGFSPELGQAYGGIVNIVTKSGGNNFHGEIGSLVWDHRLRADREKQLSVAVDPERSEYNVFGNLGGPLVRDKLWFFISNNFWRRADDQKAESVGWLQIPPGQRRRNTDNFFGKMTFSPFMNHTISLSGTYDKFLNQTGGFGVPERYVKLDYTDYAYRLNYKGILGSNTLLEAAIGRSSRDSTAGPLSGNMAAPSIKYIDIVQWVNNVYSSNNTKDKRTDFTSRFTQYVNTEKFGNHEFGAGFLLYNIKRSQLIDQTGDDYDLWKDGFFDHGTALFFLSPGVPYQLWEYRKQDYYNLGRGIGVYLKDKVIFRNVTLMIGVRSETQKLWNDTNQVILSWNLGDFISPRFSLAWDITGDGVNVFKLGIARLTDTVLFDLLPYFTKGGGSYFRVWRWVGPLPTTQNQEAALKNPNNWKYHFQQGGPEEYERGEWPIHVSEGVHPDRMNKVVAEFDRRIGANWAVKVRGVYTKHYDMLEDLARFDAKNYWYELMNWKAKKRSYTGLEIEVQGRIADKFFLSGSYVYSSAKGTTQGAYEAFDNYGITAVNTVGTFGDHFSGPSNSIWSWLAPLTVGFGGLDYGDEGWYGPLPQSCDHAIKMLGTWMAPYGFMISANFELYKGYRWSAHGFQPAYGIYGTFPEGRGKRKYPTHGYIDLSVEKDFLLASGVTFGLRVNINNLLNSQEVVSYANGLESAIFGQVWGRQFPRWLQFQVLLKF